MEHETEMPEIKEPRLVSRRTLVATAAWAVPAVTILGATPAYAASFGRDNVLSRPRDVTDPGDWVNPNNVKGIDDVTTQVVSDSETGSSLEVSRFQIPIRWQYLTNVLYATVEVKWRVDATLYAPELQVVAEYGGASTTVTDSEPTIDELHTFTVELDIDPTTIWTADRDNVLIDMAVEITPITHGGPTTFYVDAIYLLIGYQWHL